jgi:MFS family permease
LSEQVLIPADRDGSPYKVLTADENGNPSDPRSAGNTLASTAFWGFLITQLLGAFNDNYYKQMVLLICRSNVAIVVGKNIATAGPDRQSLAMAAFALPFVLLSGVGGFLSDRYSKRSVIVGSKIAEIVIMALAFGVLLIPGLSPDAQLMALISVLCLMGAQSAIFGPSKYGILPELFRHDKLLPVNGAVQMTTFLAIIFGTVCAGIALDQIRESLWIGGVIAVGIATAGTLSAAVIPKTRIAEPTLKIRIENFAVPADVKHLVLQERGLLQAILVASVFWLLGGVTQMSVNTLGTSTLGLSSTRTSLMVAAIGFGIAAGCIVTGFLGRGDNGRRWVTSGAWSLFASLLLIGFLGSGRFGVPGSSGVGDENILASVFQADRLEWSLRLSMILLGFAAGMFVVPVQVYLQRAPPDELKGRVLGVQNMVTWIGILMSAAYYWIGGILLNRLFGPNGESQHQWLIFMSLAILVLPIGLFYRLPKADQASVAGV